LVTRIQIPVDAQKLRPVGEKRVVKYASNAIGQVTNVSQLIGNNNAAVTLREYDKLGRVIKTIDALGNVTIYSYDNLGRKTSETNAEGGTTKFTYDNRGRMKTLTDPIGNTTSWTYNIIGQTAGEHVMLDGLVQSRLFFYDASGNIISKVDRNNRITEWTFDRLNRHTSEIWYDNYESWTKKNATKKFVTTYNRAGKLSTVDDGENKFSFSYGVFGNETKQVQKLAGLEKPVEFNYTTDITNLRTETNLKASGNEYVTKYEFDTLGRTKRISQNDKLVTIDYNNFGERKTLNRFADGKEVVKTDYNWDTLGRVTEIKHGKVNTFAYTWDNANRITRVDSANDKAKYEYDKTSQLVNAKYTKLPEEKYSYDLNGNRKTSKTGEYNRLLSDNENSYQYDNEGNRITKISSNGTTKYSWDNRNRLVKVETPNETVEYVYDYQNRLVKRTQDKNETVFIHDNYQVVLQLENNKPTHQYLWGTNQDELLCDNDNWALGDHLNSVRDIVSANGSVTHFEYDAFGKLLSENADNTIFAYTGKMRDNVSDLQWNINRWYDANVGKWCSEDPIGFMGKDVNLFRYVKDMVTIYVDKLGLFTICPDKCATVGNISEITVVESGVMSRDRGHPRSLNSGFSAFDNAVLIATLINVASLGNAALMGVNTFTEEVVTQLAMGGITPDTDVIRDRLNNLVNGMQISNQNSGVMIWINIQFKECQTVSCCFNYTRRNYVTRSEWYNCDLGNGSNIEDVPNKTLPCIQQSLRRAGSGEQGDRML
jgi:RHS repeat-associated protein